MSENSKPLFTTRELIRIGPYRLFFPLAIVCGLLGVGHWTLWSIGWVQTGPGPTHALIQTQGFLGCVATGFLMTFLPRVMGVPESTDREVWIGFSIALFLPVGFLLHSWNLIQISFLGLLINLIFFGVRRIKKISKKIPRPLILLDFGVVHAVLGTLFILLGNIDQINSSIPAIGRQMVQLGFLLCLVLAMTAFLTPFLTGYGDQQPQKISHKKFHAIFGLGLLASFLIEPTVPRVASILRAGLVTTHMIVFGKLLQRNLKKAVYIRLFKISHYMIPLGLIVAALFPIYRIAALHITFIGGFSLMIFSFGSLVVLSHAAQAQLLNKPMKILWFVGISILMAMAIRVSADLFPIFYFKAIHYASGFWILGAATWLIFIWPKLWKIN